MTLFRTAGRAIAGIGQKNVAGGDFGMGNPVTGHIEVSRNQGQTHRQKQ